MAMVQFKKASRKQAKAAIMVQGLSGSGKSGAALALAHTLVKKDWDSVYALDSENKSLSLYVDNTLHNGVRVQPFLIGELSNETGYKPSVYQAYRDKAIEMGGKAFIADSMTHMWQQKGGVLDMVSKAEASSKNKYTVWGLPEIAAEKNIILDLVRSQYIHTINTVRVKEKMAMSTDAVTGKTTMEKLGEMPQMLPGISYEPDLVISMVMPGAHDKAPVFTVEKSRYAIFEKGQQYLLNQGIMDQLAAYLEEGVDPDTLLNQQRLDYIDGITVLLDENTSSKAIWPVLKKNAGHEKTALKDMDLKTVRLLYAQLVAD